MLACCSIWSTWCWAWPSPRAMVPAAASVHGISSTCDHHAWLGIALLFGAMRVWRYAVEEMGWTPRSGQYGDPPSWKPWLAQMLVWGFVASGEKVVTALLVIIPLHGQLDGLAEWIEAPLRRYPNAELLLVMVVAPMLLNALYFWVIDNLIKLGAQGSLGHGGSSPSLH